MVQGVKGLRVVDLEFDVPLDHEHPGLERITVFAREVSAPEGGDRPWLVFFQGGPGSEAPRPTASPPAPGWLGRALRDFRVLLLDQRGTGRSTPVGDLPDRTPAEQAEYLAHFRADSIVRDAEWIRQELGVERWSVLGQSFGGFCVLAYLSQAPGSLREALITGGLPPVAGSIDHVYEATYEETRRRNRRYHERYPADAARLHDILARARRGDLRLPSGDALTARRVLQAGSVLGASDGAERLHYLLELQPESRAFLHDLEAMTNFARNPLYAVLHEACWADGGSTRWAAERVLPDDFREGHLFTGEHVYPWLFDEHTALAPLRAAAQLLAEREWPRLYDAARLAANEVPVAAAVYVDDMYVPRRFSEETAASVRGLRPWITNEYEHNGLRVDGERILDRLLDLVRGGA